MIRFVAPLAALVSVVATPALAAEAQQARVHATVVAVTGSTVKLAAPDGTEIMAQTAPETRYSAVRRASLSDIRPGSYVGAAALPAAGGTLRAVEVHIFPESMRGAGEGHRPMDPAAGKTMTNGTVGVVGDTGGGALTVTYPGGEQRVQVTADTPVVALEPAGPDGLRPGAKVVVIGRPGATGLVADRFMIGLDGLDPPL
jgi:hypothetical protein